VREFVAFSNVSKGFRNILALKGVSFSIPGGSIAGLIGPNGAGKSTILKIIGGLLPQDEGDVYIMGRRNPPFYQRARLLSYMTEGLQPYPDLKVGEFANFVSGGFEQGREYAEALGLSSVWKKRIKALSKGYTQRLKLFCALANEKKLVVLDEPFEGFDPIQLLDILNLLKKENFMGRTFVLSTHNIGYAERVCDYFVLLKEAEVVEEGDFEALKGRYGSSSLEEIFIKALA